MKVYNLENENGDAQRNQFVIEGDNETVFQSYQSAVCKVSNGTITFGRDWDYSTTTGKHLHRFLSDYGLHDIKKKDIQKAINQGFFDQRKGMKVVYDPSMK